MAAAGRRRFGPVDSAHLQGEHQDIKQQHTRGELGVVPRKHTITVPRNTRSESPRERESHTLLQTGFAQPLELGIGPACHALALEDDRIGRRHYGRRSSREGGTHKTLFRKAIDTYRNLCKECVLVAWLIRFTIQTLTPGTPTRWSARALPMELRWSRNGQGNTILTKELLDS